MTTFRRLRGERLLAAALLLALAPPSFAAEVSLTLSGDEGVPASVWVAPLDASGQPGTPVVLPRAAGDVAPNQARYVGELAPGAWRLVGVGPGGVIDRLGWILPAARAPRVAEDAPARGLASLLPDGATFDVPAAGDALDLGRAALLGDGNLPLLDRRSGDAGWRVPVAAHAAHPVLSVLREEVRWVLQPLPTQDGRWVVLGSGNRLALSDGAQGWRMVRVIDGGYAYGVVQVEGAGVVVRGQRGELEYVGLDGSQLALSSEGLPAVPALGVDCDAALRCVVGVDDGTGGARLYLSTNAREGGWREVATIEQRDGIALQVVGEDVLVVGRARSVLRVPLDGATASSSHELPGRVGPITLQPDGAVAIGRSLSRDGGRTWVRLRMADGDPHVSADGEGRIWGVFTYPTAMPRLGEAASGESLRRGRDMPEVAGRGAALITVDPRGTRQYLWAAGEVLVSDDRGQTFAPDAALYAALTGGVPGAGGASRAPAARGEAAPDASRVVALLDERVADLRVAMDANALASGIDMSAVSNNVMSNAMASGIGLGPAVIGVGIGNALAQTSIARDIQATADYALQPLVAQMGNGMRGPVGAGLQDGLLRAGRTSAGTVFSERPEDAMFERVRVRGEVGERLLLKQAEMFSDVTPTPVGLSQDYRRLRVGLSVVRLEGTRAPYHQAPTRQVAVLIDAPAAASPSLAYAAWAANGAQPMRHAVRDALGASVELALAEWPEVEEAAIAPIDILTSTGAERVYGVLLAQQGPDLVIGLEDDVLLRIEGRLLADVIAEEAAAAGG